MANLIFLYYFKSFIVIGFILLCQTGYVMKFWWLRCCLIFWCYRRHLGCSGRGCSRSVLSFYSCLLHWIHRCFCSWIVSLVTPFASCSVSTSTNSFLRCCLDSSQKLRYHLPMGWTCSYHFLWSHLVRDWYWCSCSGLWSASSFSFGNLAAAVDQPTSSSNSPHAVRSQNPSRVVHLW